MKNADMPAMPQESELLVERIGLCPTMGMGLTKREIFAMNAMAAIVSSDNLMDKIAKDNDTTVAMQSLILADALLAELDK